MDRRQPTAGVGACVRDAALAAGCTRCVSACPVTTLAFGVEGDLEIDASACTGCGACAAICPTGALTLTGAVPIPRAEPARDGTVLLVCPRRAGALCIHALGLEALADIWLRGGRRLALSIGECAHCPNGAADVFDSALATLNDLLADRGLAPLVADTATVRELRRLDPLGANAPDLRRRALFRAALPEPDGPALTRLQRAGRPHPGIRFAHGAGIDGDRCTGCNACVQICPSGAMIDVNATTGESEYGCNSSCCLGCGLCADVCDTDAITILSMKPRQAPLPLARFRCRGCGVESRIPTHRKSSDELCPVCARTGHFRRLYQVLP